MNLKSMRKILAAVLLAGLICLGAGNAETLTMHREADDPAIEMRAEIGYGGVITYSKAMPLRVRIRNNGVNDLEGTLGMNAYLNSRQYNRFETHISVPSGAEKEYLLPFSVMTRQEIFTPEIVSDGKVIEAVNIKAGQRIDPNTVLVGALSTRARTLANLDNAQGTDSDYSRQSWKVIGLDGETLPDQDILLDSFGILIADDLDPASLTGRQQEALARWIDGGHILLCGAGGGNIAYFSDRTGLTAGGAEVSRQVVEKLEQLADISPTGDAHGVAVYRITGGEPMIADDDGNGLVFRTESGNGRIYTTAFEMGDPVVFGKRSLRFFWQNVLENYDSAVYYNKIYSGYESTPVVYPGNTISIPVHGSLTAACAVCGGALVLGAALWLILKKKGKQSWMWLGLPVLAAAAAGAVMLISGSSDLNKPMVTYAENVTQRDGGILERYIGINGAVSGSGMHSYQLEGAPISLEYRQDMAEDFYNGETKPREPAEMAMCYTAGDSDTLSLLTSTPWEMTSLYSESPLNDFGRVEGEIWMEEDGLHGTVRNDTRLRLKEGKVLTGYGYVSIPELAPGDSADFALRQRQQPAPKTGVQVPGDGEMDRDGGFYMYNVMEAALGLKPDDWNATGMQALRRDMMNASMSQIGGGSYDYSGTAVFMYSAEAADGLPLTVSIDGKPVRNTAGLTLLNAELTYSPVGKTGLVYRVPGMTRAVRMATDENGMPAGEADQEPRRDYYGGDISLSERPVFRFDLDEPGKTEMTMLRLTLAYGWETARCTLLNAGTGQWDEIRVNENVPDPAKYVNDRGELFCRFEVNGRADYDITIPEPALTMEGRERHAEN